MKAVKILLIEDILSELHDTADVEIISPSGAVGISPGREARDDGAQSLQVPQGRQESTPPKGPVAPGGALESMDLGSPGLTARANAYRPCGTGADILCRQLLLSPSA